MLAANILTLSHHTNLGARSVSDIQKYTKFRPVLTLTQITRIADLVSQSTDPTDISIKRVMVPMIAKVETGAISPAYLLSQTHQLKQEQLSRQRAYESGHMTPEQESAYEAEILGDLGEL
jgi:hypothetical protein